MIERCLSYRRIKKAGLVDWPLVISSRMFYLMELVDGQDIGIWSFEAHDKGMKIHANMGEKCRGRKAIESAKEAFQWIFKNTNTEFIYAEIPRFNKKACYVASWAGMKNLGIKDNSRLFKLTR